MPAISLRILVPHLDTEKKVLVEEDAAVSSVLATTEKECGLEEGALGLYWRQDGGGGNVDVFLDPASTLSKCRVRNNDVLIVKEAPMPLVITMTKTVLVDPAMRVDAVLAALCSDMGYGKYAPIASDMFALHAPPEARKSHGDTAFGIQRGRCTHMSCGCSRYQTSPSADCHLCLNCGHYPAVHVQVRAVSPHEEHESIPLDSTLPLVEAFKGATGGDGALRESVLTLKSKEVLPPSSLNVHRLSLHASIPAGGAAMLTGSTGVSGSQSARVHAKDVASQHVFSVRSRSSEKLPLPGSSSDPAVERHPKISATSPSTMRATAPGSVIMGDIDGSKGECSPPGSSIGRKGSPRRSNQVKWTGSDAVKADRRGKCSSISVPPQSLGLADAGLADSAPPELHRPRSRSLSSSDGTPRLRQWAQKKQKIEEELLLDRASQNFGIALPDLLAREQDETIPELVRVLLSEMREREIYVIARSLFRISENHEKILELRAALDRGDIACLESASEHSLANLLKLFLKCLPEPLFSWKLWPRFLAIPDISDAEDRVIYAKPLVNSLHKTLKSLLGAVVRFLRDLLENKEDTKMGAENLGIVFGPLLIPQNLEAQNSLELISRTSAASTVLQLMCANYQQLFVENKAKRLETVQALNAYKSSSADELKNIKKGSIIHVVKRKRNKVYGELDGKFGWFPTSGGMAGRSLENMLTKRKRKSSVKGSDKDDGPIELTVNPLYGQMVKVKAAQSGFDPEWEELFLDDVTFAAQFGCSKAEYCCLPKSRRTVMKMQARS